MLARTPAEVLPALRRLEQATAAGMWAFGYVGYEAAAGLGSLPVHAAAPGSEGSAPLLWFGLSHAPATPTLSTSGPSSGDRAPYRVGVWRPEWSESEHADRVAAVHRAIAAGETYQCNLTTRLHSTVTGDLHSYYLDLADHQRGGFSGYLDTGSHVVLSTSPECFLEWTGDRLRSIPMKGTAPRGPDAATDRAAREGLVASRKDAAENVMIVDLIRNDLSRVADVGTVTVDWLLRPERYAGVWQLTSAVSGRVAPDTPVADVFTALFPCGSVTGTPKRRTMELIAELESGPRGVYCGAVGYLAPDGSATRARFNVAIRTVVVQRATGAAVYGVGGGVTWDSTAAGEYAELVAKARVLDASPETDVALIETLAVHHGEPRHLTAHLARLAGSADHLGFRLDPGTVTAALTTAAAELGEGVLRLQLARDGGHELTTRPLPVAPDAPVELALDTVGVDPDSTWLRHKTTRRQVYDDARARHPGVEDVLLVNTRGQLTESTVANLAVLLDGTWCTPPVTDGCLPGIGRSLRLQTGELVERSISPADLERAEALALVSSVRGWRPARLRPGSR